MKKNRIWKEGVKREFQKKNYFWEVIIYLKNLIIPHLSFFIYDLKHL